MFEFGDGEYEKAQKVFFICMNIDYRSHIECDEKRTRCIGPDQGDDASVGIKRAWGNAGASCRYLQKLGGAIGSLGEFHNHRLKQ